MKSHVARPSRKNWREGVNINADRRQRIGDTILPLVDPRLTLPAVRTAPWVTGTVDDALALPSRGWIVGHFDGVAERSADCQVKFWAFTGTLMNYPWKRLGGTEIDFVYAGALHLALRKRAGATIEYVTVRAGNWLLVRPGTCYRALAGEHVAGVTVRWPSEAGSKVAIGEGE